MEWPESIAVLVDGGFVTKILSKSLGHFPDATEVDAEIQQKVIVHPELKGRPLYRVFYYDAEPWTQAATNPISKIRTEYGETPIATMGQRLLRQLELKPNYAVRRGVLACHGWKVGHGALARLQAGTITTVTAQDLVPDFEQKGVDMRIGLDMASLAVKRLVGAVVLVTGDSDMVPAMKFARREGLRVYLHTLGSISIRPELKVHADVVLI